MSDLPAWAHLGGMMCPECRDGKHANCTGWALHPYTDDLEACDCVTCHGGTP
jgi:hypothetical protein